MRSKQAELQAAEDAELSAAQGIDSTAHRDAMQKRCATMPTLLDAYQTMRRQDELNVAVKVCPPCCVQIVAVELTVGA